MFYWPKRQVGILLFIFKVYSCSCTSDYCCKDLVEKKKKQKPSVVG